MMQKQLSIERKDWLDAAIEGLWPARVVERLKNILILKVPEGYQDEKGFHFGARPTAGL